MKTNYHLRKEEKNIKRLLILILFLAGVRFITAQEYIKAENGIDSFPKINRPNISLKIAPLALLGPYEGTSLRMGLEYKMNKEWSNYTELIHYFFNTGEGIKTEFKYFLPYYYQDNKHSSSRDYFSVELFYKRQCYKTSDTIIMPYEKYNKQYNVTKSIECFTIKYGEQTTYKCGITLDVFVGLGIRLRQATNSLSNIENAHIKCEGDYGTNCIVNMASNNVYPNFDVGVKIGFRLK